MGANNSVSPASRNIDKSIPSSSSNPQEPAISTLIVHIEPSAIAEAPLVPVSAAIETTGETSDASNELLNKSFDGARKLESSENSSNNTSDSALEQVASKEGNSFNSNVYHSIFSQNF